MLAGLPSAGLEDLARGNPKTLQRLGRVVADYCRILHPTSLEPLNLRTSYTQIPSRPGERLGLHALVAASGHAHALPPTACSTSESKSDSEVETGRRAELPSANEGENVTFASVLRLDDLPVGERFDFWWQAVAQSVVSVDAASEHSENYWAEMHLLDLGTTQLSRVRCVSFVARRGTHHIRRSDAGLYQLSLTLSGRSGIQQGDREACLSPTDFVLYDTSRTFRAWSIGEAPRTSSAIPANVSDGMVLQFPHDALPLRGSLVEPLLGVRLSGRDGFGALLNGLLRQLTGQPAWSASDLTRLNTIVLDLVTALLAQRAGEHTTAFQKDPQGILVLRIKAFIEERLGDRDLSPSTIAAAHHISLRYLHKLFQDRELTVAGWIRERRLERCRRDLADPVMDHLPIGAIGARWGFPSHAHFTRTFHRAYGTSPSTYRALFRNHGTSRPPGAEPAAGRGR